MLTVETAVIAFVDFNSSSCNRKGQSYPVEYFLESVEEYCTAPEMILTTK